MFCEHCKKIIEARIKFLESLDKDPDRAHAIQQLEWLIESADEIVAMSKMTKEKTR